MKNLFAFIAIIGMVAISTNIQAYCNDSQNPSGWSSINCAVNYAGSDGGFFYAPTYQTMNITQHVVAPGAGPSSYATASVSTDASGPVTSTEYDSGQSYNFGSISTGSAGYVQLYVEITNTGGYAYSEVYW